MMPVVVPARGSVYTGRVVASEETKLRRRENRRIANAIRHASVTKAPTSVLGERRQRERLKVPGLVRRYFGEHVPSLILPIVLNYAYWQARVCGWDVLSKEFRRDANGKVVSDPADGAVWLWWTDLHYESRDEIRKESFRRSYAVMKITGR